MVVIRVKCSECGRWVSKPIGLVKKQRLHFCDMTCYTAYRRKHTDFVRAKKRGGNLLQRKLKNIALIKVEYEKRY